MCRFQRICTFEQPDKSDLEILQDWLRHTQGGNHFLRGYEADTWDEPNKKDLVSMIYRSREKDRLSKWIDVNVIPFYHHMLGHRHKVRNSLLSTNFCPLASTPGVLSKVQNCPNMVMWYRIQKFSANKTFSQQQVRSTAIVTVKPMPPSRC